MTQPTQFFHITKNSVLDSYCVYFASSCHDFPLCKPLELKLYGLHKEKDLQSRLWSWPLRWHFGLLLTYPPSKGHFHSTEKCQKLRSKALVLMDQGGNCLQSGPISCYLILALPLISNSGICMFPSRFSSRQTVFNSLSFRAAQVGQL